MNTSKITLPNGELKDVYFDFNELEFKTQHAEIFGERHYEKGLRKKNMVVLDIGANIGLSVLFFKEHAKKIYAIEPNSIYYNFLTHNVGMYPNVKTFNIGLGLGNCKQLLFGNPGEERTESIYSKGERAMEFQMETIDKFFEENKIKHVDVMKIDTEGSEYPILMSKGFGKVASKIDYIIGESHFCDMLRPDLIPVILGDYGFKVNFLPYNNLFTVAGFNDSNNKPLTKMYKVLQYTIFEAYR